MNLYALLNRHFTYASIRCLFKFFILEKNLSNIFLNNLPKKWEKDNEDDKNNEENPHVIGNAGLTHTHWLMP